MGVIVREVQVDTATIILMQTDGFHPAATSGLIAIALRPEADLDVTEYVGGCGGGSGIQSPRIVGAILAR